MVPLPESSAIVGDYAKVQVRLTAVNPIPVGGGIRI